MTHERHPDGDFTSMPWPFDTTDDALALTASVPREHIVECLRDVFALIDRDQPGSVSKLRQRTLADVCVEIARGAGPATRIVMGIARMRGLAWADIDGGPST